MRVDGIDEALRRQSTWTPPPGFARKVARLARQQVDTRIRVLDVVDVIPHLAGDLARDSVARLAGLRWIVRQYWLLLAQ